jgi:hypothetical protein
MKDLKTGKNLSSVDVCLTFLTDDCIDQNRKGIDQLNALMKLFPAQATAISQALIYGGGEGATLEGDLRDFFAALICEKKDADGRLDQDFEEEDDNPWGRHSGRLHLPAIKLLITCLEIIQLETKYDRNPIDFESRVWKSMFNTLAHNIRECHDSAAFTGYSVKCLRILHELEPATIGPIVKYTLFPFLVSAQEYGESLSCKMLEEESQELLQQSGAATGNNRDLFYVISAEQ